MRKNDKISIIPSTHNGPIKLLTSLGNLKWNNKYDCPKGYNYNEDEYVETNENHLQICITMMPYLLNDIGEYQVLYQNAVAFRVLNPSKSKDCIEPALKYKFRNSYYRLPNDLLLHKALKDAYSINSLGEVLGSMHRSIFSFHSIWCSKDCTIEGRNKIYALLRDDFIDRTRSFMPVNTKFKTKHVMETTEKSEYAINIYWKNSGLDRKARTLHAFEEALEEMTYDGVETATMSEIGEVAGLSRKTVGELISRNK